MKIQIFSLEKFNDTKRVIRSRKSKKDRKHNDQKKKDKWTNNVLQNITQKTEGRATRTSLKSWGELRFFPEKVKKGVIFRNTAFKKTEGHPQQEFKQS
jgi:hypothetical protein